MIGIVVIELDETSKDFATSVCFGSKTNSSRTGKRGKKK